MKVKSHYTSANDFNRHGLLHTASSYDHRQISAFIRIYVGYLCFAFDSGLGFITSSQARPLPETVIHTVDSVFLRRKTRQFLFIKRTKHVSWDRKTPVAKSEGVSRFVFSTIPYNCTRRIQEVLADPYDCRSLLILKRQINGLFHVKLIGWSVLFSRSDWFSHNLHCEQRPARLAVLQKPVSLLLCPATRDNEPLPSTQIYSWSEYGSWNTHLIPGIFHGALVSRLMMLSTQTKLSEFLAQARRPFSVMCCMQNGVEILPSSPFRRQ